MLVIIFLNLLFFGVVAFLIGMGAGFKQVKKFFQDRTGDNGTCTVPLEKFGKMFCYERKSWISIAICMALVVLSFSLSVDEFWKSRVDKYEKGEIKKVVTYKTKSIDGVSAEKDSTYTYKFIK